MSNIHQIDIRYSNFLKKVIFGFEFQGHTGTIFTFEYRTSTRLILDIECQISTRLIFDIQTLLKNFISNLNFEFPHV